MVTLYGYTCTSTSEDLNTCYVAAGDEAQPVVHLRHVESSLLGSHIDCRHFYLGWSICTEYVQVTECPALMARYMWQLYDAGLSKRYAVPSPTAYLPSLKPLTSRNSYGVQPHSYIKIAGLRD